MDQIGDAELVVHARAGDIDAFTTLVERYRPTAVRVAYGIAGDEAEDAVQDAFVKTYAKLDTFRTGSAFRPWLFAIVANEARNRRRSMSRRVSAELRVRDQPAASVAAGDAIAIAHDERRRLVAAVNNLPEHHREVIALRFFAGLSEHETAEVLTCAEGTVKSRLSRALDGLRTALGDEVRR